MAKQYSVRDWVKNTAADKAEIAAILERNPAWKEKHARELLARRRFITSIKSAGKPPLSSKPTNHSSGLE